MLWIKLLAHLLQRVLLKAEPTEDSVKRNALGALHLLVLLGPLVLSQEEALRRAHPNKALIRHVLQRRGLFPGKVQGLCVIAQLEQRKPPPICTCNGQVHGARAELAVNDVDGLLVRPAQQRKARKHDFLVGRHDFFP